MVDDIPIGTRRVIEGRERVYYYGYWIRAYDVPENSLEEKKRLIQALTRRLFNHVEHGINVPGERLEEARRAFDSEEDPARRRVKGAMLAGALFNRATQVFTKLVEIQALGVEIRPDNELLRQCGEYLKEALSLGRLVLHRSGEEGIDELWGEPFKAFAFPIQDFYESRYVKIAQTMHAIDAMGEALRHALTAPEFDGIPELVSAFTEAAKAKCETLRTDADLFEVWTTFVVTGEALAGFRPAPTSALAQQDERWMEDGLALLRAGQGLISDVARARVPMPKSAAAFIERCEAFRASRSRRSRRPPPPGVSDDASVQPGRDLPGERPGDELLEAH
ncbi:MAG TPA: hypothetical protein VHE30_10360 [Polyangiaceae bacterium]|nr:hypothetical protein [Polyangiaceae bacterium]